MAILRMELPLHHCHPLPTWILLYTTFLSSVQRRCDKSFLCRQYALKLWASCKNWSQHPPCLFKLSKQKTGSQNSGTFCGAQWGKIKLGGRYPCVCRMSTKRNLLICVNIAISTASFSAVERRRSCFVLILAVTYRRYLWKGWSMWSH